MSDEDDDRRAMSHLYSVALADLELVERRAAELGEPPPTRGFEFAAYDLAKPWHVLARGLPICSKAPGSKQDGGRVPPAARMTVSVWRDTNPKPHLCGSCERRVSELAVATGVAAMTPRPLVVRSTADFALAFRTAGDMYEYIRSIGGQITLPPHSSKESS